MGYLLEIKPQYGLDIHFLLQVDNQIHSHLSSLLCDIALWNTLQAAMAERLRSEPTTAGVRDALITVSVNIKICSVDSQNI